MKAGTITLDARRAACADRRTTLRRPRVGKIAPGVAVNTYQNGAYWHTPTGWLLYALYRARSGDGAQASSATFIAHLREQDFRKGEQFGAPWECFDRDGAARQNPIYMASVAAAAVGRARKSRA